MTARVERETEEIVRVLVVCSGNVCRSPLAERLLRARLESVLGAPGRRIYVTSAGTGAMVGSGMDSRAAAVARELRADPVGFTARQVELVDVAEADLVLGATREHRAAAVRLYPPAHRYAFTVLEFARLVRVVPGAELPPVADPPGRLRALTEQAAALRGLHRAARPELDDVADPHGGQEKIHREVGEVLSGAVSTLVDALAGREVAAPLAAVPADSSRRAGRTASRGKGRAADSRSRAGGAGSAGGSSSRAGGAGAAGSGGATRAADGRADGRPAGGVARGGVAPSRSGAARAGSRGSVRPGAGSARLAKVTAAKRRNRRIRMVALRGGLGLLALVLLGVGWVAARGLQAQHELVAARADVTGLRTALLSGDVPTARAKLADVQRRTGRARDLTGDPVWRLAGATPYAGANPAAVRTLAVGVDDLATGALPALVGAGAALDPAQLRPAGDRVSLAAFSRSAPAIASARATVVATRDRLGGLDGEPLLTPVADAVTSLRTELTDTARSLDGVGRASRLAPVMLGADGPRRYLVVFQNNAEARATGGLVGAYAVVTANGGRLKVEKIGSNTDLRNAKTLPVDLGRDFRADWGDAPALWVNGNLDANFPNAAKIWLALWKQQTGQALDGVLATDPVALGYLLTATGPVKLGTGETIDSGNAARLTMQEVYNRSDDNAVRDGYLRSVAGSVVQSLVAGRGSPRAVLDQLGRAAGERRLLLYSTHAAEQKDIAGTALSGVLSGLPGPYAYVAVNNAAGNKMDYYLRRNISYAAGSCTGDRRTSRLTITLGNGAPDPARLPEYVSQRLDDGTGTRSQSTADGSIADLVSVYGPLRGGVVRATLDGKPMSIASGQSGPRPVWTFPIVIEQGRKRTVVLEILEPPSPNAPVVAVQPLVQPATTRVSTQSCE